MEVSNTFPLFEKRTEAYLWIHRIAFTWNEFLTRFLDGQYSMSPQQFVPLFRATRIRLRLVLTTLGPLPDGPYTRELHREMVNSMTALKNTVTRLNRFLGQPPGEQQNQEEDIFVLEEVVPASESV